MSSPKSSASSNHTLRGQERLLSVRKPVAALAVHIKQVEEIDQLEALRSPLCQHH